MERRVLMAMALAGLAGCISKPQTEREKVLAKIRELIVLDRRDDPKLPETGAQIPAGWSSSRTLYHGVWVDDALYYEALGVPMGRRPAGDDVQDRQPGIPDQVFGKCERCKRSWKWVSGHVTWYSGDAGCSPLCERCWKELSTPEKRLPYYRALFDSWNAEARRYGHTSPPETDWLQIRRAVLEGK